METFYHSIWFWLRFGYVWIRCLHPQKTLPRAPLQGKHVENAQMRPYFYVMRVFTSMGYSAWLGVVARRRRAIGKV